MEESLKNNFKKAIYEPDKGLAEKTWKKVIAYDKKTTRFRLVSFSVLEAISLIGLVPVFKILLSDFTQSGFYEYLSLAFSKDGLFSSYGKEFAFSLVESLPILSTLFFLSLIFIFFLSLKYIIRQTTESRLSSQQLSLSF